jgi:hypothetical protein
MRYTLLYTVFAIFLAMMLLFKTNAQLKIRVQGVAPTFPPNWLLDINHYIYCSYYMPETLLTTQLTW